MQDMTQKDPNWGKNITGKGLNPPIKGKKPNMQDFQLSLGLNHNPKERMNIEKVFVRKRMPPPRIGETFGLGN